MHKATPFTALLICLLLLGPGCKGDDMTLTKDLSSPIEAFSDSDWQRIGGMKIYFGHHSVGANILSGLSEIMRQQRRKEITILETEEFPIRKTGLLAHSGVGKNGDPTSKVQEFEDVVSLRLKAKADVALFKFCYVDITTETDVEKIFQHYRATLAGLQEKNPDTRFIHVTTPLTVQPSGMVQAGKNWIKKLLGRKTTHPNMMRTRFNQLMRDAYLDKEPFFDLARVESTDPRGKRAVRVHNGTQYHALVPEYTDDGGHLNRNGQIRAAEEFLRVLADIP